MHLRIVLINTGLIKILYLIINQIFVLNVTLFEMWAERILRAPHITSHWIGLDYM